MYKRKHGKNPKAGLNKLELVEYWIARKGNAETEVTEWAQENEAEIETLRSGTIELDEKELGKQKNKVLNSTLSIIPTMT